MEKMYYDEKPNEFETIRSVGVMTTIVRLNIEKCEDSDQWQCDEFSFNHKKELTQEDYGKVISSIIRSRFSADDVEAIQQNYIESKTKDHKEKFTELKSWRAQAKDIAKSLLGIS